MGNNSIKSSKKKFCCLSTSSSSSFSIDDKSFPTFDRISSKNEKKNSYQSIDELEKFLSNTSLQLIINKFQLKFYLKDYLTRLKTSKINQTFQKHFLSTTIIYPCNGSNQFLIDDLNLFIITPPESILPNLFINSKNSYKIHEQIRSKCYFIPLTNYQIEPNDDEYKQKLIPIDRTHVVITLDNNQTINTNKNSIEIQSSYIFISNDLFQTGFLHIDQEKILKEFLPFIYFSSEDNRFYLSSNLIQKWFNTLILVNQTCSIVKRFLIGDKNHITCLFKQQNTNQEK
jgi:hypothetical protein